MHCVVYRVAGGVFQWCGSGLPSSAAVSGNVVEDVGPPEAVQGVGCFEDKVLGGFVFDDHGSANGDDFTVDEVNLVFPHLFHEMPSAYQRNADAEAFPLTSMCDALVGMCEVVMFVSGSLV